MRELIAEQAVAGRAVVFSEAELASLLARGWHVVSYTEAAGTRTARIRARRP